MIAIALYLAALQAGSAAPVAPAAPPPIAAAPAAGKGAVTTASGLRIETLTAGSGRRPEEGGAVLLTYEGKLADGTVFDAAVRPTGLPVSGLVTGFTEALLLTNVGGTYRIWLPPELAYGAEGAGGVIPPNAAIEFTLTVLDVRGAAELAAPPVPMAAPPAQ